MPDYSKINCPHCGNLIEEDWFELGECPRCHRTLVGHVPPTPNDSYCNRCGFDGHYRTDIPLCPTTRANRPDDETGLLAAEKDSRMESLHPNLPLSAALRALGLTKV